MSKSSKQNVYPCSIAMATILPNKPTFWHSKSSSTRVWTIRNKTDSEHKFPQNAMSGLTPWIDFAESTIRSALIDNRDDDWWAFQFSAALNLDTSLVFNWTLKQVCHIQLSRSPQETIILIFFKIVLHVICSYIFYLIQ